jgi:nucleotide-binding universal stress UspA family protein
MFGKILVCLDGSKLAENILPYAIEQAKRFGSEIVLLRVIIEPTILSPALPGMPGLPLGVEKSIIKDESDAETYLTSMADRLQSEEKLRVSYDRVLGAAGPAIIEYCGEQKVELIAIATHGRSGLGRAVLGSVADYVIKHSDVPILLIRPTGDDKE